MNRVSSADKNDFSLLKEDESRIVIGYGLTRNGNMWEWYEVYVYKIDGQINGFYDIKNLITNDINSRVDENILNGYQWKVLHGDDEGKVINVWLSAENQTNFKAKHDAALQYPQLMSWPMKYKIGEYDEEHEDEESGLITTESRPVYEYFQNIEELARFYLGGMQYIQSCYEAGWAEKDNFDWTPYENLFKQEEAVQ